MGTKTEHDNDPPADPPPGDPPPGDPPPAGSGDTGGDDPDGLGDLVEEKVGEALAALGLNQLAGAGAPGNNNNEGGDMRRTAADTESHVESVVQRELAKFHKEKERDERLERVEHAVEQPPVKVGRVGRFLWGDS